MGPKRNRKEEYMRALVVVNKIEKLAEELIKDYTPAVYAKYFKSSNSISFNQQVNIAEIS